MIAVVANERRNAQVAQEMRKEETIRHAEMSAKRDCQQRFVVKYPQRESYSVCRPGSELAHAALAGAEVVWWSGESVPIEEREAPDKPSTFELIVSILRRINHIRMRPQAQTYNQRFLNDLDTAEMALTALRRYM